MTSAWDWQPWSADVAAYHGCGILGDGDGNLVLGDPAKAPATASGQMRVDAAPWVPPGQHAKFSVSTNKAFAFKDPNTGEVIPRSALLGRPDDQAPSKVKPGGLTAEQKARWQAAAGLVTAYMRQGRWTPDHSSFSALNVDEIRRPGVGRPRRNMVAAQSSAQTAQETETSAAAVPQETAAPVAAPQDTAAPAAETKEILPPAVESCEPSTDVL
eukprot:CAMPEP_0172669250 /NCGR_PEP_ID=MMETSP1074-20121228/9561_1 /TAXON_ID=2916 /ORGANISM="Ceratium fusus, Strain PA161109" /LENGTH=213 /DNA_ID=CAMNT_0013485999 /DNA_START=44 /DNA_END=682 /DNA_ORIENTATION=+